MILWDRRSFLLAVGQAMLAPLFQWACGKNSQNLFELATGPCRPPTGDEEETLFALADTVVPGAHEDPKGRPGAIDACALEILLDPSLPVIQAAPIVVVVLDELAKKSHGKSYKELTLSQRTEVTHAAEKTTPLLGYLFKFIRGIYYVSQVAYDEIGYAGPNLGYINHPDFSLREPLGEEMTAEGNLP